MSHMNFECSTGKVLICYCHTGLGHLLFEGEGDLEGDLDLPPMDADSDSLLLGGRTL